MLQIQELDQKYIWHPYTQHGATEAPLAVKSGRGAYLELEDGTRVLDAVSSWWVNVLGHCHSGIATAIKNQLDQLEHVLFAGFTHDPAVRLAQTFIDAVQNRGAALSRVFYSDNGSTAVEVALKMAFQYQVNRGQPQRQKFLALNQSYHGDTFGAMAVGEPKGFHPCFRPLLTQVDFFAPEDLVELDQLLAENGGQYAALIVEPLIQGAAGMKIYSADFLAKAVKMCRDRNILIIFDEVFTGFYRTGTAFAFEQAQVFPDFLCLSKGLTGGFLPLAATLTTHEIFQSFFSKQLSQAFLHGHSYTANPLACSAALATWDALNQDDIQNRIRKISILTESHVMRFKDHPRVKSVRHLGTIGAVELEGSSTYFSGLAPKIRQIALKKGVLLRPLGNVIYAVPPYCVSDSEVDFIYQVIQQILDDVSVFAECDQPFQGQAGLVSQVEAFEFSDL